jgi:membrane protease YdiL (CAAX protease family)
MKTSDPQSMTLVRWQPSSSTAVALLTELGMIIAYAILGQNANNIGVAALVGLVIVPILAVVIPVYWTTMVERQGLEALGITSRHWLLSLLLGLGLSLVVIAPLLFATRITAAPERWLPMAAAGAFSLFEPLFIFGWLQLRFEKDFGILPAILLAALCYALYHIGYLPQEMTGQFYSAAVFAVAFRLTANLLVAWPLLWAATSAQICIGSNVCFANWGMVSGWAFAFVVEVVLIAAMGMLQRRRELRTLSSAH